MEGLAGYFISIILRMIHFSNKAAVTFSVKDKSLEA